MGLVFGLLAGLAYGLAVWGLNAFRLWQSAAEPAWLMAGISILLVTGVGGLVGWLCARIDNAFVAFLAWVAVGVLFSWLAMETNYHLINQVVELLYPEFDGLHVYPLESFIRLFRGVMFVIIGFTSGLAGVFQLYLVEAAVNAGASAGRVTIIIVNLMMFAAVGLVSDTICQRPLREPLVSLAYSINDVKSAAAEDREPDGMSQRALKVLGERIYRPYKLFSGTNDPDSLITGTVHLDFSGEWAMCTVFEGVLSYCDLSEKIFAGRLGCLLDGGTQWACMIHVPEEKQAELQAVSYDLGEYTQIRVVRQMGDAVLLDLQGQAGASYRCVLRLSGNTVYDRCIRID
jgi:hypothetical protein